MNALPPGQALEEAEKLSRDISWTCSNARSRSCCSNTGKRIGEDGLRDIAVTAVHLIVERQLWPTDLITWFSRSGFEDLPGPYE